LIRVFDRDLVAAGIARRVKIGRKWHVDKRDERGRTVDVHALRTTFGTLLSKGGVPLRTAQAAMRHSDPKLTANVYTDPKLLDVHGALDALPLLPLDATTTTTEPAVESATLATGTEGNLLQTSDQFALAFALTLCKPSANGATAVNSITQSDQASHAATVATTPEPVKRKDPLTTPVISGHRKYPHGDLNPGLRTENPTSLAARRWGLASFRLQRESQNRLTGHVSSRFL